MSEIRNMKCGIVDIGEMDNNVLDDIAAWAKECCTFENNHGIEEYVIFLGSQEHGDASLDEFISPVPSELVSIFEDAYKQGFEYLTIYLG